MALKDITITASINSYPTLSYGQKTFIASTDQESFPIETSVGSQAGVWPEFVNGTNYTTNLYVNVTQSWAGSRNTPVGIVPFIHNNNEEFFNGEFSGSILEITNGNLTDSNCIEFLKVNTTPINYNMVVYATLSDVSVSPPNILASFSDQFLNRSTSPDNGEILIYFNINVLFPFFASTPIYAKIARIDADGNNNTLSLQELKRFIYTDTTAGEIICNVKNITEYPDYYFYELENSTTVQSNITDNNIRTHSLDVSNTGPVVVPYNLAFSIIGGSWTLNSAPQGGTFNSLRGFQIDDTPNIYLTYTASLDITPTSGFLPENIQVSIIGTGPGSNYEEIDFTVATINSPGQNVILTGSSNNFIKGFRYGIKVRSLDFPLPVIVENVTFKLDQTTAASTSTNAVVIEPYLTNKFSYGDCDVLMNNASENDYSNFYRKVLYENGGVIPSNFQQIINGTAEFAEMNDYLYNANASKLPRYEGVRSESPGVNQSTTFGGYGTLPNVESLQTYFAYYDYITSSYAELLNKSVIHILYLIDENGDTSVPTLSSSYYYNLIDNFETNKNVNINLNSLDNASVIGLKSILRPGAIPWGICASQTGSGFNIQPTMSFVNNTSTTLIPNYASLINGTSPYQQFPITPGGGTYAINFSSLVYSGAGNVNVDLVNNYFQILTTSNNVTLNLNLEGSLGLSLQNSNPPSNTVGVTIYCQESPNGTSWTNIDQKNILLTYGSFTYINLDFNSFIATANKYYRIVLYHGSGYFSVELTNGKISLIQDPISIQAGYVTSSYWHTGSNSKNILTGSQFLPLYNSYNLYQLNYPDSGYKNFLKFNISPADEIRFEGDESQVYIINNVTSDNLALYLELNRDIVDGTNLDSFLIRRYEPHPNFITLNWDGVGNIEGDGFIFPEYSSIKIRQNFDNIIAKLKEKGIL